MERPWRALWFMLTPNPTSPFVYTGSAAAAYFVLCLVDLWVLITGKGGHKLAFRMTLIALPFAIYLHTTTAFVLSLNKSRELWNTAMMVPIFLTSATASGIALLFIFAYIVQATTRMKFQPSMFRSLATLMGTVMIIDLFLLVIEIITVFWKTSAKTGHVASSSEFFYGSYGWTFVPVLVLGISAFALISRRSTRHQPTVQLIASGMYVVAVFLKRYSLLGMGFVHSTLGQARSFYMPSLTEVMIALGLLAMGLILVTLSVKALPLEVPEDDHDEHDSVRAEVSHEALAEGGVSS
jgi:molybdopterin-containing oxidoreductase family membrane subunit